MRSLRLWLLLALAVSSICAHAADKKPVQPPAPTEVVTRVRAAHSIFIANPTVGYVGYTDSYSAYKYMYQALAAWPDVKLVGSPAEADLVFEALGTATGTYPEAVVSTLTIFDPRTNTVVWTTSAGAGYAYPNDFPHAQFGSASVELLFPLEPQQPAPKPADVKVLIPSQLKATSKVYLQTSPSVSNPTGVNASDLTGVNASSVAYDALVKAKLYTLVATPDEADLILTVTGSFEIINRNVHYGTVLMTAIDPKTKLVLWTHMNTLIGESSDAKSLTQTMPFAIKDWKSLISKGHV